MFTKKIQFYNYFEENADFDHSVDCADIMEPCNLDGDCCEPYVCEDGRCYFAQGKYTE